MLTALLAGLILHLLSFFTLPYHNLTDDVLLEQEIRAYPGYSFSLADPIRSFALFC